MTSAPAHASATNPRDALREVLEQVLARPMPPLENALAFDALPGWDSVTHLALLLAIERHFDVAFTSTQMVSMKTIGDCLDALLHAPEK